MGSCWSDGSQATGVGPTSSSAATANDAVDYYLKVRGFNGLFSQIELSFSASNLRDGDVTSKSDAMVVVYTKGRDGGVGELFRSEVVLNSLNPKWIRKCNVGYQFEIVQTLLFRVYDVDTQFQNSKEEMLKLDEQQFLGEATCTLSEVITKSNRTIALELMRKEGDASQNNGKLVVHAEESLASKTTTEIVFRCLDLESKDHFSKSDPFLVISTILNARILIPFSQALKSQLFVDKFTETVQHTFLEYLASGFELNFMVAIDFTASNGNPRLPDSLHYIDPTGRLNAYQRAIVEVGEVLQFYDYDKRFPAWGFGARPIDIPVSHCFNLNGSSTYCEVDGIQGIMNAYNGALFNVSFAGPTLFGPVINAAATIASESLARNERKYYVLLIITDGVITDLQETKDALVSASDLPLSILIVGVGGADYKEMEVLDGDKGERLESSSGRVASRDIVQFVALRDIQYGEVSVVEALLAELPSQFLTYMKNKNITPQHCTDTTYHQL